MTQPVYIAVIGGSDVGAETAALAREVGREVAARGAVLLCGGLGGVMAAAAQGAGDAGGAKARTGPRGTGAGPIPTSLIPSPPTWGMPGMFLLPTAPTPLLRWMGATVPCPRRPSP